MPNPESAPAAGLCPDCQRPIDDPQTCQDCGKITCTDCANYTETVDEEAYCGECAAQYLQEGEAQPAPAERLSIVPRWVMVALYPDGRVCSGAILGYEAEQAFRAEHEGMRVCLVPGPVVLGAPLTPAQQAVAVEDIHATLSRLLATPAPAQASAKHIKSGKVYRVIGPAKHKVLGERWVETVWYVNDQGERFSREVDNFAQSFAQADAEGTGAGS